MFTRILSPLAAEPNLALNHAYVRRTPLARLGIVYQIEPQYNGGTIRSAAAQLPQNNAIAYSELLNKSWSHAQLELSRNLGQGLYLDSIIMGGVDGESLPVTLDSAAQAEIAAHLPGGLLDMSAEDGHTVAATTELEYFTMNATIARRLILCGIFGLLIPGCGGGDIAPHRVPQEPVRPSDAAAAADFGDGVALLGSRSPGDRLLPRQRSPEQATIDALARIGAPSVPALVDVLHDSDPELRRDAARALARIGSDAREAVPELIAALDDKDAGVRSFATRALGEIGPAAGKAVPALIKELRQNAKATEQAAKAAAAAAAAEAHEPTTGAVPIAK